MKYLLFAFTLLLGISCGNKGINSDAQNPQGRAVINVKDYGVSPRAADNTEAFRRLNQIMVNKPGVTWVLNFEKGTYRYSDNLWLTGVNKFVLNGTKGTQFQNIYGPVKSEDCRPLSLKEPHRKKDSRFRYLYENGEFFEALSANTVKVKDTRKYKVGELVLLSGFEQQYSGFPPNPRYFDFCRITKINNERAVLTLDKTINPHYDTRWEDYCWGTDDRKICSGKPRILNLSKTDFGFAKEIEINNITFLPNPNCDVRHALVLPGEYVTLRNVTLESVYPRYNRRFSFIGGEVRDYIELDKIVDSLVLKDVVIRRNENSNMTSALQGATAVNHLFIEGCEIEGKIRVSPRNLEVKNSTFYALQEYEGQALIEQYNNFFPIDKATISNINIVNKDASKTSPLAGFDKINEIKLPQAGNKDFFLIPDEPFYQNNFLRSIDYGQILYNRENDAFGAVDEIFKNGKNWQIAANWEKPITRAIQTIEWVATKRVVVESKAEQIKRLPQGKSPGSKENLLQKMQLAK